MEIPKEYFTLEEVLRRWKIPAVDLRYLAETDQMRLSFLVFNREIELGCWEEVDIGRRHGIPWHYGKYRGLLDLYVDDIHALFRFREWRITQFRHADADYGHLILFDDHIDLRVDDLYLRQQERARIEQSYGFGPPRAACQTAGGRFQATPDYRAVVIGHRAFKLGPIQARIVKLLHHAALDGMPWQSGKEILTKAGSRCLRMQDVFKSQPGWRELIESDGRGAYRLILQ